MHEASLHKQNSFITLTYNDDAIPARGLNYSDFQKFMKRLRKKREARFFMCGEYGEQTGRPHYHACLFGTDFDDKQYWRTTPAGSKSYVSETLTKLWGHGNAECGDVTFESAGYVARYCTKKINGDLAEEHYKRWDEQGEYQLPPEFGHMSLKPGIGAGFLKQWESDIYPHDYVIVNGMKTKPPKYYDKKYQQKEPEIFEEIQWKREQDGARKSYDNTPQRLKVRETVQRARAQFLKRTLE